MTITTPTADVVKTSRVRRAVSPFVWVWFGVALLLGLMLVLTPNQVSPSALGNTMPYVGLLALVAMGQVLVVMQRGIDFSIVGALVLAGIVGGTLAGSGMPLWAAVLATVAVGFGMGAINGVIVVFLRLTPLVATLASNLLFLGLAIMIGRGAPVHAADAVAAFARAKPFGLSSILLVAILVAAALVVLVNRTVTGRRFIATGSNPAAAWAAGIRVNAYTLTAYCLAGVLYALAGLLLSGYVGDARMAMGGEYLMTSIAAVVIGGTSLAGGRGSIVATVGGALFMTLLTQFVLALGAPAAMQLLVQAVVLIAAVTLPSVVGLLGRYGRRRATSEVADS
jgi:ribose transport system permease protein